VPLAIKKLISNPKVVGYRLNLRGICSGIESEKNALETEVPNLVGCPCTDV
jgi:hypothetical protein